MKWIRAFSLLVIVVAAGITVFFVSVLKPTSPTAFALFALWLISPHVAMSAALFTLGRKSPASIHWYVVAVIVSVGGIVFLSDVIFWQPDAQGAIAVMMAPLLQGAAWVLSFPAVWWWRRGART